MKYTITFAAKGNGYTTSVPVTIIYEGGKEFTYNANISVNNRAAVNIKYPFAVDDSDANYATFNARIGELTNGVDGLAYDLTDLGSWLGYDTSVDNWKQDAHIKYDLALKGDTINLEQDTLLNINRYETYLHVDSDTAYAKNTYYKFDKTSGTYVLEDSDDQPSDWGELNYYTKLRYADAPISKIELVAVSNTYANSIQNVKDSLAVVGNTITISQSLNFTGYLAFKIYAGDTLAYGYYIVKVVDDDQFDQTIASSQNRYVATVSEKMESNITIINLIRNSGQDISTVAHIADEIVNTDSNNVYLFVVDSQNNQTGIAQGNIIPNSTELTVNSNIQVLMVAVVVQYNTSLVHVCNYRLVLQPNVEVITGENISITESAEYYIYSAKSMKYDFTTDTKNTITFDKKYFTITDSDDNESTAPDAVVIETSMEYSRETLTFDGTSIKIGEKTIAKIDDNQQLVLLSAISQRVFFYLKLSYGELNVYLRITLDPFEFNEVGNIEIGNLVDGEFANTLDLTTIYGDYDGELSVKTSTDKSTWTDATVTDNKLVFEQGVSEQPYYVRITLLDVAKPMTSNDIAVKVKPSIKVNYDVSNAGTSQSNQITPDLVGQSPLSVNGSQLYLDIDSENNIIKVQSNSEAIAKVYATINVGSLDQVNINLTNDTGDENKNQYIVSNVDRAVTLDGDILRYEYTESGAIYFAHTAGEVNVRLNISILNDNGNSYEGISLFIKLPKTYDLLSAYRITGAQYETRVDGSRLSLGYAADADIATNFFGNSDSTPTGVNPSRIAMKIGGENVFGIENFRTLGLLDAANPNFLNASLTVVSGTNKSSIDSNVITFRKDADVVGYNTLVLSNDTTTIEYVFMVLDEADNYNSIKYNDNLVYIEGEAGENDYISISKSQLDKDENGEYTFELAYLKYLPDEDGEGWIATSDNNLSFKYVEETSKGGYQSKIVIEKCNSNAVNQVVTVNIITINGVADTIDLVISDFEVKYGYEQGESSEELYAGTEGYLLNGQTAGGKTRVEATVGGSSIFAADSEYTITYAGAVNGAISHLPVDTEITYGPTNSDVVWYNVANKTFGSRSVKDVKYVTMIFNVKQTISGVSKVIGRICYSLTLKNDIRIGINPLLDETKWLDLYLGANIYSSITSYEEITTQQAFDNAPVKYTYNDDTGEYDVATGNLQFGSGTTYYAFVGETNINLLQSESFGKYNNLFVTLEQYSTGNTIYDENGNYIGNALYNGSDNAANKTQSILDEDVVSEYLSFGYTNVSTDLQGKVRVTKNGILKIKGNASGSFNLLVYSANGTGYGKSFTIKVHQYETVTAKYDKTININSGTGYASGTPIHLINSNVGATDNSYAFNVNRLSNVLNDGKYKTDLLLLADTLTDPVSMSYKVNTFPGTTTVAEIKASTTWDGLRATQLNVNAKIDESNLKFELPSVPYSTQQDTREYYIVSIRLAISYNGQVQYYYANYRVYNEVNVSVNEYYNSNGKVITYGDNSGAWGSAGGNKTTITIMDIANKGMYSLLTPLNSEPDGWSTTGALDNYINYYQPIYRAKLAGEEWATGKYYTESNGIYTLVTSTPDDLNAFKADVSYYVRSTGYQKLDKINTAPKFVKGMYYKLNDLVSSTINDNYKTYIRLPNGDERPIDDLTYNPGTNTVTGTLPHYEEGKSDYLFTNETKFTFVIKSALTNAILLEEEWTFKADTTIKENESKPLSTFFLQSEIGQDLYSKQIVGMLETYSATEAVKFVKLENGAGTIMAEAIGDAISLPNSYSLQKVKYYINSSRTVFKTETERYVLVGNSEAMGFYFNGGSYYINLTVDGKVIEGNDAPINLLQMIKMWWYDVDATDGVYFKSVTPTIEDNEISVVLKQMDSVTDASGVSYANGVVTLENIHQLLSNKSVYAIITIDGVTRKVELRFNIIINARNTNDNGDDIFNEGAGQMTNNEMVATALEQSTNSNASGKKVLTVDDVERNVLLKQTLLTLITFNGQAVDTEVYGSQYNYFTITVEENSSGTYTITYTYNDNMSEYSREFVMAGSN